MKHPLLLGLVLGLLAPLLRAERLLFDDVALRAVTPPFREYVGSTLNGDFEVGTAATGNQYWGQYVPRQSSVAGAPAMMTLITDPTGTAPGATRSGKNMIAVARGGQAWNFANLSASAADQLPRVGDLVGGSYWLYVPDNADLSAGVPNVYFIHQGAGGDTIIADTAAVSAASLVKGAWNRVPIYPKAGAVIASAATKVAVMIAAPSLDPATNPLYPSLYYIDEIRVGVIPSGVFLSSATTLTDGEGGAVAAIGPSGSIHAETVVQNSSFGSPVSGYLVLKLYEKDVLKSTRVRVLTVAAKGASGISNTPAAIDAPLDGLDRGLLNARLHLYADAEQTVELATSFSLAWRTRSVSPADPAIQYFGRWSADGAARRGEWIRPYFKVNFTGSSSVKIRLLRTAGLSVSLDGVRTDYNTVNGLVTLGSSLALSGTHTLRVAGQGWQDTVAFSEIVLDESGALRPPAVVDDHIEFIGDSITAWNNGYSWLVPERLGVEASRIAWPGIALVDGFGYYTLPVGGGARSGMQSAYFQTGMPGFGASGAWDFAASPYSPGIIVVNLGTNDSASITGDAPRLGAFEAAYRVFLQHVRARHRAAAILVLRPFSIGQADVQASILRATQALIDGGDAKLRYVDTSDWGVAIGSDGVHPTDAGHVTIADRLVPLLAPSLSRGVRPYAPSLTSVPEISVAQGTPLAFTVSAIGNPPPVFGATGLPTWASLNPSSGQLVGTPDEPGRFTGMLTASNGVGADARPFVVTVTASFEQWVAAHFTPEDAGDSSLSGRTAIPRGDGVSNLLKYAFAIDPAAPASGSATAALPRAGVVDDGRTRYVTLTYLRNATVSGIDARVESSTDLATWRTEAPDIVRYLDAADSGGLSLVEAGVAMGDAARKFLRLRVDAR